jgi:hypothetical protein
MTTRGLPHSETPGSLLVGSSPGLFAACYVLHRLSCQGIHLCALMYLLRRFCFGTQFEIAVHACAWTRSHVWHMKVLLYAVFKERGATRGPPAIASRKMSESLRFQGRALKAEQCSPDEDRACAVIILQETLE